MWIKGQVLMKYNFQIPDSFTEGKGNSIQGSYVIR